MTKKRPAWAEELFLGIRALGVGLEDLRDDVKLLVEQHVSTRFTLDEHTEILNGHTEMIGNIAIDLTMVKEGTQLEQRVAALEKNQK